MRNTTSERIAFIRKAVEDRTFPDGRLDDLLAAYDQERDRLIEDLARVEAEFKGQYFFTPNRIPLKEAIIEMRVAQAQKPAGIADVDFGCGNAICGV